MKPRNYFPNAIGALSKLAELSFAHGRAELGLEFQLLKEAMVEDSVCWHLAPEALKLVWLTDLQPEVFKTARLPYSAMALEYDFDNDSLGLDPPLEGNSECRKRCTVLVGGEDKFVIYNFFVDEALPGVWHPIPYTAALWYSELEELARLLTVRGRGKVSIPLRFSGLVPSLPFNQLIENSGLGEELFLRRLEKENNILDDLRIALSLIQLLTCHNSPPIIIEPAPEKLNAKRGKAGKVRIPEYRMLWLTPAQQRTAGTSSQGHHASPRGHYRRGHIRRQWYARKGEHRNVWIEPTFVCGGGRPNDVEVRS